MVLVSVCGLVGVLALASVPAFAAAPTTIGSHGEYAGQVEQPQSVAVDQGTGDLYVADENAQRIDEFEADGTFVRAWGYGVSDGSDAFQVCTTTCFHGIPGSGPGQFDNPRSIAVAQSSGDVYVAGGGYLVEEFSASGELLSVFGGQVNKTEVAAREAQEADSEPVTVTSAQEDLCTKANLEAHQECGEAVSGSDPGELSTLAPALAVDGSGDVWVGDFERLEEFTAGGAYLSEIKLTLGSEAVRALGIDPAGDFYVIREDVSTGNNIPGVEKLEGPAGAVPGALIETLDETGSANALGVDPATGDVFISDQVERTEDVNPATLLEYDPSGTELASFATGQVSENPDGNALAVDDSAKALYVANGRTVQSFTAPAPGPYVRAGSLSVSAIKTKGATLEGTLNPENAATKYRFEYVTEQQFKEAAPGHGFEDATKASEGSLAVGGGEGYTEHALEAEVSEGLAAETTYHFRLFASNANGTGNALEEEATFTTLPSATIPEQSATQVTADSAILSAEIDPLGQATEYHFEYLTEHAYQENVEAGNAPFTGAALIPSPDAAIGEGEGDQHVSQHLQELEPSTAYRYRVVAHNANGPSTSATQTFTTQAAGTGFTLVDDRQWELVSPPDKYGALLVGLDRDDDAGGVIQAAANGETLTYMALAPTETDPRGNANAAQILATRTLDGWDSQDIAIPHDTATGTGSQGSEYRFFSSDLSRGVLQPMGAAVTPCAGSAGQAQPCLSSDASEPTPFLGAILGSEGGAFTPLVTGCPAAGKPCEPNISEHANVPPGTKFGEQGCEGKYNGVCGPHFLDATPDASHIVLKSQVPLTETKAVATNGGLYEWADGALTLVSVLPESEGGGPASEEELASRGYAPSPAPGAISENGSRVVWRTGNHSSSGTLYLRDLATSETLQVDASEAGCAQCSGGEGRLQFANAEGSRVFFTDPNRLIKDSASGGGSNSYEPDLYECEVIIEPQASHCALHDLTPLSSSGERAAVVGSVLGASTDGEWVYFVADGRLEPTRNPGAVHGTCGLTALEELNEENGLGVQCNLYVWHDGITKLVTVLSNADRPDWSPEDANMTARVSPDGQWLTFMSLRSLTGYDNRDAVSGQPDEEVYVYHATAGELTCASCNPTGARPSGVEMGTVGTSGKHLYGGLAEGGNDAFSSTTWIAGSIPGWTAYVSPHALYQSRYLSNEGLLFFNSSDALVPQDVNGTEDVYEYEPQGVGSESARCGPGSTGGAEVFKPAHRFEGPDGTDEEAAGCVGLISSGSSPEESAFLDASESGGNVFFLTAANLAPQDVDTALDVYDAHECTNASPCIAPPATQPPPCTTESSCKASPTPQPSIFGLPPSATFSGAGNLTPTTTPPVAKPKAKPLTRAQKLAAALRGCKKDKRKSKRQSCEKQARAKYGPTKKQAKVRKSSHSDKED